MHEFPMQAHSYQSPVQSLLRAALAPGVLCPACSMLLAVRSSIFILGMIHAACYHRKRMQQLEMTQTAATEEVRPFCKCSDASSSRSCHRILIVNVLERFTLACFCQCLQCVKSLSASSQGAILAHRESLCNTSLRTCRHSYSMPLMSVLICSPSSCN